MALDNYADLQTAVLNWLARPGDTTISTSVPDMISLFEGHVRRSLFTALQEDTTTFNTSAGVQSVAVPVLFAEARVMYLTNQLKYVLRYITPEEMATIWIGSEVDQPEVFTIEGTNILFAPVPDAVYPVTFVYIQGLPSLSNINTINWLLTNHPDAYLFGTLAEAEAFIGNDERIPMWIQRRDLILNEIKAADLKQRWSGSVLMMRTDTGNP